MTDTPNGVGIGCCTKTFIEVDAVRTRRAQALNRELVVLSGAAVISFALTLIGILGLYQLLPLTTGGSSMLLVLGCTGFFATGIAGVWHVIKRVNNTGCCSWLRDIGRSVTGSNPVDFDDV